MFTYIGLLSLIVASVYASVLPDITVGSEQLIFAGSSSVNGKSNCTQDGVCVNLVDTDEVVSNWSEYADEPPVRKCYFSDKPGLPAKSEFAYNYTLNDTTPYLTAILAVNNCLYEDISGYGGRKDGHFPAAFDVQLEILGKRRDKEHPVVALHFFVKPNASLRDFKFQVFISLWGSQGSAAILSFHRTD
ncbi:hypothetical protein MP228_009325 [Amoeboaphelidium protococcarum]|nr:hypothetical protein MP228_009325 [Amoeboaphelidium protococcarum]